MKGRGRGGEGARGRGREGANPVSSRPRPLAPSTLQSLGRPVRALALLVEVDLRLRIGGFARLSAALDRDEGGVLAQRVVVPHPCLIEEARRMAQWLRWASRYVPGARCLHRSVALALWFRRRGVTADLCLGVRADDQGLSGHAWVECGGLLFEEEPSVRQEYGLLEEVVRGEG